MSDVVFKQKVSMKKALVWTSILGEPLFTLHSSIAFILYKEGGASAFQIALLTMLKPVITILSFYWSSGLKNKGSRLRSNVIWAGIWMRVPFLFCPWIDSIWYVIFAAVNYTFFYRAGSPGWLEMLRRTLPNKERTHLFSFSSAISYLEGVLISLGVGVLLDKDPDVWKGLFFIAAVLGLVSVLVQKEVQIEEEKGEQSPIETKELLIRPWRDSIRLLLDRKDFAIFQIGFMICGFGIMLIQPALPLFVVDCLGISYLEILTAISVAKGLGFVISSPLWSKYLNQFSISVVASIVFLVVGLFPFILSLSVFHVGWLYLAFFCYGIGQGGSHLVWNLSGPHFAGSEDSSRFTGVGVVLAGLRGAVASPLGGFLAVFFGSNIVLALGGVLCFYSGFVLLKNRSKAVPSFIK